MKNGGPRVVILGAGPAGLGAALGLARRGSCPVLIEQLDRVGGNAGSFELQGLRVDFGSHRLHPTTDPGILATIRSLLGSDLLQRPRHGRIRLGGRWIHFPLHPLDLALRAPPSFVLGVAMDLLRKVAPRERTGEKETFASLLQRDLGPTICREFYFPYARKIWGLAPEEISPVQAMRRVSAGSLGQLLARLFSGGTGSGGGRGHGTFFYPREGFGQISEALFEAAVSAGAEVKLSTAVRRVRLGPEGLQVELDGTEGRETLTCDHLWSTIPISSLVRIIDPPPPGEVLRSARGLRQRAMLLVYLVLEMDRFTEFDAHYFPGLDLPFTRISEPKNYSGKRDPAGRTVLCAEIPCSSTDELWSMNDRALGERVRTGLAKVGLPIDVPILEVAVRRLLSAYPLFRTDYESHFDRVDSWLGGLPGIVSFGRQGLFAHDNTHHALFMAQAAVHCLKDDGRFDESQWAHYRGIFNTHVVED